MKLHITYCGGASTSCGVASDDAILGHHAADDEARTTECIIFPAPADWRGDEPDSWYEARAIEYTRTLAPESVVESWWCTAGTDGMFNVSEAMYDGVMVPVGTRTVTVDDSGRMTVVGWVPVRVTHDALQVARHLLSGLNGQERLAAIEITGDWVSHRADREAAE